MLNAPAWAETGQHAMRAAVDISGGQDVIALRKEQQRGANGGDAGGESKSLAASF